MVLELGLITVKPGTQADFEVAFATAATDIIGAADGFHEYTGHGWGIERPDTYMFTVRWQSREQHLAAFAPGTPLLAAFEELVGPFIEAATFEHYSL